MVVPPYGGCPWPVDTACFTDEWETFSPEVQARAIALASATLHRLTGKRVGGCPITVRPCTPRNACGYGNGIGDMWFYNQTNFFPNNWNGTWSNACGCADTRCGHDSSVTLRLPPPIGYVDSVKVDGSNLELTAWYVAAPDRLIRTDGNTWPLTQNLSLPDTEVGTFSVTYLKAYPVDSLGAYAAGVMSMEYGRACAGNSCRLPSGVRTIARQGITMDITPGLFPDGMTGIREVDTFISLWNPNGLQRGASVYSPDLDRRRA